MADRGASAVAEEGGISRKVNELTRSFGRMACAGGDRRARQAGSRSPAYRTITTKPATIVLSGSSRAIGSSVIAAAAFCDNQTAVKASTIDRATVIRVTFSSSSTPKQ